MSRPILQWRYWIFDMDGTLTLSQHDFDAIRAELGLPVGQPILEALAALPPEEAAPLHRQLDALELEIAHQSQAATGAGALLSYLVQTGAPIGIVTRNNRINVDATLRAAGLQSYFQPQDVISRDCAAPKPAPDGILRLLKQWQAPASAAVMVGDFLFDLEAGRHAGVSTVYVDPSAGYPFRALADVCIRTLDELLQNPGQVT